MTLTKGTRIYNGGDMANADHFGTITKVETDRWGTRYEITADPLEPNPYDDPNEPDLCLLQRAPYWIPACAISPVYKGHGGTRIVTEVAYQTWRKQQYAAFIGR